MASRRPDLSGADVLLRDEGEGDALRDRHTEWSRITLGGKSDVRRSESSDLSRHDIIGYHLELLVTDMLIRNVPDDVVAAVDARASRLGLSRSEYVRRRLAQDAAPAGAVVSTEDLDRFSELFGDLDDPDVMSRAWR